MPFGGAVGLSASSDMADGVVMSRSSGAPPGVPARKVALAHGTGESVPGRSFGTQGRDERSVRSGATALLNCLAKRLAREMNWRWRMCPSARTTFTPLG